MAECGVLAVLINPGADTALRLPTSRNSRLLSTEQWVSPLAVSVDVS